MIINGIKIKEVKQTGAAYECKGCIFYHPGITKEIYSVCAAPDDVICHFDMIFVKDE